MIYKENQLQINTKTKSQISNCKKNKIYKLTKPLKRMRTKWRKKSR